MAKGFTVKAKAPAPKKSTEEWDYELAKQMIKGKTVVFCLPGRGVSYTYLKNFVQLCFDLVQCGASIQISQDYSSMVNFARCKCLGANVLWEDREFNARICKRKYYNSSSYRRERVETMKYDELQEQ